MEDKKVILENVKPREYTVNYEDSNGNLKRYRFNPARQGKTSVLEVPIEVYEYLLNQTSAFSYGNLRLANEYANDPDSDEGVIGDYLNAAPEVIFTIDEISELLKNATKLKAKLKEDSPRNIVEDFIKVAKDTQVENVNVRKYLAKLIGCEDNIDLIFE